MKRRIANWIVRFLAPAIIDLLLADARRRGPLYREIESSVRWQLSAFESPPANRNPGHEE